MDDIRTERRPWRGPEELERRHMLEVGEQTEVLERRSCLASHSRMCLSFRKLVVIVELYEQELW